jgi:hypothetical protein
MIKGGTGLYRLDDIAALIKQIWLEEEPAGSAPTVLAPRIPSAGN